MNEPGVRVHKVMARAGLASLREAERMIRDGRVRVNGQIVRKPGCTMVPGQDALEVNGVAVDSASPPQQEVWALYKPRGCVSTLHDPEGRPTVRDYFPPVKSRLFTVGRLDYDAEGLILLTNDGALANRIAHPSHGMEKTYLVKIKGLIDSSGLQKLAKGPVLAGAQRQPVRARVLHTINDKTWLEVVLKEGVNHHIKKMFRRLGHRVLKIKRYKIGTVALEDMNPGDVRRLSGSDVTALLNEPIPARSDSRAKRPMLHR